MEVWPRLARMGYHMLAIYHSFLVMTSWTCPDTHHNTCGSYMCISKIRAKIKRVKKGKTDGEGNSCIFVDFCQEVISKYCFGYDFSPILFINSLHTVVVLFGCCFISVFTKWSVCWHFRIICVWFDVLFHFLERKDGMDQVKQPWWKKWRYLLRFDFKYLIYIIALST